MELNDNSNADIFIKEIFNLDSSVNDNHDTENINSLYLYMEKNGYDQNVPYPAIAHYIYWNENIDPEFGDTIDRYFGDNYPKFAEKFKRHVDLSLTQKTYILKEVNNKIHNAEEEVKNLNDRYIELEERANKMSSEYISILGIFSALIFGLFGGFNTLTSSFNTFIETETYGQAIFYLSILALALVTFIYFLLYWIGIIIDKPIHNTDDRYIPSAIASAVSSINTLFKGKRKKKVPFTVKHETYLIIVAVLFITTLSGIIIDIIEIYINIKSYIYLLLGLLILLIIVLVGFLIWIMLRED